MSHVLVWFGLVIFRGVTAAIRKGRCCFPYYPRFRGHTARGPRRNAEFPLLGEPAMVERH